MGQDHQHHRLQATVRPPRVPRVLPEMGTIFFFSLLRLFDAIWLLRALATTIPQYQQQPRQSRLCFGESHELNSTILVGLFQLRIFHNSMKTKPIYSAKAPLSSSRCSAERGRGALAPAVPMTTATAHQQNSYESRPQL